MSESNQIKGNGNEERQKTEYVQTLAWKTENRVQGGHKSASQFSEESKESYEHSSEIRRVTEEMSKFMSKNYEEDLSGAFKKTKYGQINKLNQLKQQYEILKNIHIEDSMIRDRKNSKNLNSSQSSKSMSMSSANSKSISARNSHKSKAGQPVSQAKELERKNLQLMLTSSMSKIEELLRAEVEYKKKIHELTQKSNSNLMEENNQLASQYQRKEKHLHQLINQMKEEDNRLRNLNKDMAHRLGEIEAEVALKDVDIRKLNEEKRKIEESLLLEREKHLNNGIELKRLAMEKEILQKQKNSQIQRLENILNTQGSLSNSHFQNQIYKLNEEIKLKDDRYKLLLQEIDNSKVHKTEDISSNILEKLEKIEINHELAMKKDIEEMKMELSRMVQKKQVGDNEFLKNKIAHLERMMEEENEEKKKYLEQFSSLKHELERTERENKRLREEIEMEEEKSRLLKKEFHNIKNDMEISENAKLTLSVSQTEQHALISRMKIMEKFEEENRELRSEYGVMKKSMREKENESDNKIRELMRKIDELEFEVERGRKQNVFNLELAEAKHRADLQLLKNQEQRAYKERDEWKREFENMRAFYEQKMREMREEAARMGEKYAVNCESKDEEIRNLRRGIEGELESMRNKHEQEQSGLLARLESLTNSNERLAQQNSKLIHLESELSEVRQHLRRMKAMNENVDHLWLVKEAEYSNINEIVKEFQ